MSSCVSFSKNFSSNPSRKALASERGSSPQRLRRFALASLSDPAMIAREGMKRRALIKKELCKVISLVEGSIFILGLRAIANSSEIMQLNEIKNELQSPDKFRQKNIEKLVVLSEYLLSKNEREKAVTVLKLAIDLMGQVKQDAQSKILNFQNISSMLFRAEENGISSEALKQACRFVENLSTIEDKLEAYQNLAIDFFVLGEDEEVIHLMNHITRDSYFPFEQRFSVFQSLFEFMLDNDPNLMFYVIECAESSSEKDLALRQLILWILEDVENKDRLFQAFRVAGHIQNPQIQTEALGEI